MSSSSVYCRANLQLEKDLSGYLPMNDLQELQETTKKLMLQQTTSIVMLKEY